MSTYTIPANIKYLRSQHFNVCVAKNYDKIIVPGTVERIEPSAFENCTGLKTLVFKGSSSDKTLVLCGNWSYNCVASNFRIEGRSINSRELIEITKNNENMESVYIDTPSLTLSGFCFCDCPNLRKIVFKNDPVILSENVFAQLPGLTEIALPNVTEVIDETVFCSKSYWNPDLIIRTNSEDISIRDFKQINFNYNADLDVDDFYSLNGKRKETYRDEDYGQTPPDGVDDSLESYGMSVYTEEELIKIDTMYTTP